MAGVLEGIRVLDFGRYIAGPYCATLLADFGAEVIRIEKVKGSEDRFYAPVSQIGDCGATYMQMGRNKQGLTLNPRTDEGREIMRKLVATADIVVFPSLYPESFGIVNLEAMSAGVPIVSFAAGGASDFTVHGSNAVVVDLAGPRTPTALAAGIAALARNASLRAAIGRGGRATVLERFTAARAADRYRRVFAAVIARKMGAVMDKRRREKHGGG